MTVVLTHSLPNMLKFLVLDAILCQLICAITAAPAIVNNSSNIEITNFYATNGTVIHNLHLQHVSWPQARKMCQEEGGDLAVIRSNAEENIMLKMMAQYSIDYAWLGVIGYNDNWVTVFGESLNETGWARWGQTSEEARCGLLDGSGRGMFTNSCETTSRRYKFICKILTF